MGLIKGGHGVGDAIDYLKNQDGGDFTYTAARDDNRHTHGTGCTLASAIASQLALGHSVPEAMALAKAYVTGAIAAGFAAAALVRPTICGGCGTTSPIPLRAACDPSIGPLIL